MELFNEMIELAEAKKQLLQEKANISDAAKVMIALTHAVNDDHRKSLDRELVKHVGNETLAFFKSKLQQNQKLIAAKEAAEKKEGKSISWEQWFQQFSLFNGGDDKPEIASE